MSRIKNTANNQSPFAGKRACPVFCLDESAFTIHCGSFYIDAAYSYALLKVKQHFAGFIQRVPS